jgi:glycosyltransferase involved in cell wall biosynthesis
METTDKINSTQSMLPTMTDESHNPLTLPQNVKSGDIGDGVTVPQVPDLALKRPIRVLMEMRPAFDGFAGIPQEVRLLFRGLRTINGAEVSGLLQASTRNLAHGVRQSSFFWRPVSQGRKINRYSQVIISLADKPFRSLVEKFFDLIERKTSTSMTTMAVILGTGWIKLTDFDSTLFKDFIWRSLFAKTLPASDRELVSSAKFKVCRTPWHNMHIVGLNTLGILPAPKYPKLKTDEFDVFIGQTPYPGRTHPNTARVIRYHDAIPILLPHTIADKSTHQATHFYALMANVEDGAWFSCVSEATRNDLIRIFPDAEKRSVTIHNMVSHHYFPEDSTKALVPNIVRSRHYKSSEDESKAYGLTPSFLTIREKEGFYAKHLGGDFRFLLMVSTIEPRKNHTRLLAAWEVIKAEIDPDLKLVIVGTLGWEYVQVALQMAPWIDRGQMFLLNQVPAPDLRVLYKHAELTVCPSLGEGFDFSGVEAMRSGGVVTASDIAVHQEIYEDASDYFDPYSTMSVVASIKSMLYDEGAREKREAIRQRGQAISERYLPKNILPKWTAFLDRIVDEHQAR